MRSAKLVGFAILSLLLTLLPGGVWTALLSLNLSTGIAIPWSVLAMGAILWIAWRYAGGAWAPAGTSQVRRAYRRANPVPAPVFALALLANGLALVSLAGAWIVLFQLVRAPGNPLDLSRYPPVAVAIVLVAGAIVGAVSEEVGMRGYLQGALERVVTPARAILTTALVMAPGHAFTQGFVWSTVLFYVLVDIVYGTTAYLTNSVVPGIIAHAVGLTVFFAVVWPKDAARRLVTAGGADAWFWIHIAQALVFGTAALWAFALVARRTRAARNDKTAGLDGPAALA